MYVVALVVISVAIALTVAAGLRIARGRRTGWRSQLSVQFMAAGMLVLGLVTLSVRSPALDLLEVACAIAFVAMLVCVAMTRRRTTARD